MHCPHCGKAITHPEDAQGRYCGDGCGRFHTEEDLFFEKLSDMTTDERAKLNRDETSDEWQVT